MVNDFPEIELNPSIELAAQQTGIDPANITIFLSVLEEETSKMAIRVFNRCEALGVSVDEATVLMTLIAGMLGMTAEGLDLVDIKESEE